MRSDALNLERICAALDHHAERCGAPVIEIRLNPYELERLGWDEVRGVPLVADERIGTGQGRIICEAGHGEAESVERGERVEVPA